MFVTITYICIILSIIMSKVGGKEFEKNDCYYHTKFMYSYCGTR